MSEPAEIDIATYEQLGNIELEFEDFDTEIIGKQYLLTLPTYAKRAALIPKIPSFWPLVLEQAPPEIDQFVQPSDAAVFAACLQNITVERFGIPKSATPSSTLAQLGEPRSFSIKFEFAENEWFEDRVLEKKFHFRRHPDGWSGRVSEPVRIRWKKGKDLSEGMTDAAGMLYGAQKRAGVLEGTSATQKEKMAKVSKVPEYAALKKKIEETPEGGVSFFCFFGFRGRYVSDEEHEEATRKHAERMAKIKSGDDEMDEDEKEDEDDDEDWEDEDEYDVEIFPPGEELALAISEDVWPNAIKYFTDEPAILAEAQELGSDLSDLDMEDDDAEDEDDEDDDDAEMVEVEDIKKLVKGKGASSASKSKKK